MRSATSFMRSWALAAAVAVVGVPVVAQQSPSPGGNRPAQQAQPMGTAPTVTAGDIADNPESYYGKRVTVRAEVEDLIGPQAFLLDEDKLFAWPDVLVITPAMTSVVPEDEIVTVVGTVRPFVEADLRRDYDWNWWNNWDTDLAVTFRNRPVIMADSVKLANGNELITKQPKTQQR